MQQLFLTIAHLTQTLRSDLSEQILLSLLTFGMNSSWLPCIYYYSYNFNFICFFVFSSYHGTKYNEVYNLGKFPNSCMHTGLKWWVETVQLIIRWLLKCDLKIITLIKSIKKECRRMSQSEKSGFILTAMWKVCRMEIVNGK